ncbi:MDR/zinc-dependent alcohol dehydrogenase-like family protein [Chondromyces apiculatus]|uniref:Threonine dehydrogenase and Zn-dependent dehydrogenase n=1 Tax=Chondromyces apiculatus DSM 436 TaxID=1192034 RepID=A0A017T6D3_9BACT|nr:alcohol dehydrogenase catalytic domain-containing protein [Chondromyces apiculatus]EYF04360.1 Threonine dehydrogenase and Zn-dependent dehydrogenase [Chondromyces apiculatus DSM 436]
MRALTWDGAALRVEDRPEPVAAEGMAVVDVHLAGVCATDVQIVRGYMGFHGVLGHEVVGTVQEGPEAWLGKRVTAEINFACGRCAMCARGLGRHCPGRTVMGILGADGAMAERVAVPVANLHAVPEGLSDEAAVFAEPLAAAFEILEQVHVRPRTRVLVLGDGKLGLLCAQVLHQAGAEVLVVGRHEDKLALLRARGIDAVLASAWSGEPAEVVVEATGSPQGFLAAVRATLPRGTLVLKSTFAARPEVDLAPLVVNEITLVGSRCGSFPPALRALAAGSVDVLPLISARVPLARADEALRLAQQPGVLKVLVTQ